MDCTGKNCIYCSEMKITPVKDKLGQFGHLYECRYGFLLRVHHSALVTIEENNPDGSNMGGDNGKEKSNNRRA